MRTIFQILRELESSMLNARTPMERCERMEKYQNALQDPAQALLDDQREQFQKMTQEFKQDFSVSRFNIKR